MAVSSISNTQFSADRIKITEEELQGDFSPFPKELILYLLSFLDFFSVTQLSLVNKYWNQLLKEGNKVFKLTKSPFWSPILTSSFGLDVKGKEQAIEDLPLVVKEELEKSFLNSETDRLLLENMKQFFSQTQENNFSNAKWCTLVNALKEDNCDWHLSLASIISKEKVSFPAFREKVSAICNFYAQSINKERNRVQRFTSFNLLMGKVAFFIYQHMCQPVPILKWEEIKIIKEELYEILKTQAVRDYIDRAALLALFSHPTDPWDMAQMVWLSKKLEAAFKLASQVLLLQGSIRQEQNVQKFHEKGLEKFIKDFSSSGLSEKEKSQIWAKFVDPRYGSLEVKALNVRFDLYKYAPTYEDKRDCVASRLSPHENNQSKTHLMENAQRFKEENPSEEEALFFIASILHSRGLQLPSKNWPLMDFLGEFYNFVVQECYNQSKTSQQHVKGLLESCDSIEPLLYLLRKGSPFFSYVAKGEHCFGKLNAEKQLEIAAKIWGRVLCLLPLEKLRFIPEDFRAQGEFLSQESFQVFLQLLKEERTLNLEKENAIDNLLKKHLNM